MDNGLISVVVIGAPGRLRDGLLLMLSSFPSVQVVGSTDAPVEARKILTERPVNLVLLDGDCANGEAAAWLKELRTQWPQTGCLFIGGSTRQLVAARAAGADAVLMRSFQIEDLSAAIERIIRPQK